MRVADYLTASCWCMRTEVEIPVAWVLDGQTGSCGPGCGPGCQMVEPAGEDDPYDRAHVVPSADEQKRWKMNKFSPARYDPSDDSTPGLPKRAESVSLLIGEGLCACGCGETPSGKKAKFCMGHDARLKGRLTRAHSAGVTVALIEESDGSATILEALEYADRFSTDKVDWRQLVIAASDKIAERRGPVDKRAAERQVLDRARRDGAKKVGRWAKTDSVAAIYQLEAGGYEVEYVDDRGRIQKQQVDVA